MFSLHTQKREAFKSRPKRKGRGRGSKMGKTSCRGQKGMGARSGVKWRLGYEGGQMPLHMKIPKRGFSRARFQKRLEAINLGMIEEHFQDGELVSFATLVEKGLIKKSGYGLKILAEGDLTKKVKIAANKLSASAKEKLEQLNIEVTLL